MQPRNGLVLMLSGGLEKDGANYFGPYHSASKIRKTLKVVEQHFDSAIVMT